MAGHCPSKKKYKYLSLRFGPLMHLNRRNWPFELRINETFWQAAVSGGKCCTTAYCTTDLLHCVPQFVSCGGSLGKIGREFYLACIPCFPDRHEILVWEGSQRNWSCLFHDLSGDGIGILANMWVHLQIWNHLVKDCQLENCCVCGEADDLSAEHH